MKLIIGLGNPDSKYISTRHNLGHQVIQSWLKYLKLTLKPIPKLSSQLVKYQDFLFGIGTEYMNNSGLSVQKIASFYKIKPEDIYIIHDDLDLAVGEYKIQFDRGPAGHNGVISAIKHLGTQAFFRIRIGIGHPLDNLPVESYVLLPFNPEEQMIITQVTDKIVKELETIINS